MGIPEGEEEDQEMENLFGKGNRHTSPGSTQSPKQVGLKEAYTKTHHN